jgi:hypothetical protein
MNANPVRHKTSTITATSRKTIRSWERQIVWKTETHSNNFFGDTIS